ncbi:MAG: DNA phosphorothioation-associated putative methyltransferase [Candidatus Accumulibacter sp.]|uniref:DNA phosphorothioation-associated putative methyltransferase n=1 Tax=Candidatus Accumulibacter proximus TaxID=2954385 RepID=A0A935UHZ9_9PROT|nr:DNA phosphorothioation-associated putative methyltransferase [Candidatus Accumulibacter proximus]
MLETTDSSAGCVRSPWPPDVGKQVAEHLYLHVSALHLLPAEWRGSMEMAARIACAVPEQQFNVIKLHRSGDEISLLDYVDFFDDAFPALGRSWKVSLSRGTSVFRTYEESRNPPILHRKELLLVPDDLRIPAYREVTDTAIEIGLFDEPNRIGFREYWCQLIARHGYELMGGQFVPLANAGGDTYQSDVSMEEQASVHRHRTALARSNFSAPVQALSRHGLIHGATTFFDYGCGRGDDVRGLLANGIDASGWDPHYAPEAAKRAADVVNIGFVVNVIENFDERVEALRGAYSHVRGVLSVAAMLSSKAPLDGRPYGDGYLSSRNTFQKYFTQAQLRDFIEHTLDESAIAAGPGVFFVFRDKDLEQRFLSMRYRHRVQTVLARGWSHERPKSSSRQRTDRTATIVETNRQLFEHLSSTYLELGRPPQRDEVSFELIARIEEQLGSLARALKLAESRLDARTVARARDARSSDLIVFLALQQFQKRRPYRHLEAGIQRDIRYFFGDYANAQASARQALFGLANLEAIDQACREAASKGYGYLDDGQSLQLHSSLLGRLPAILRIYVECAAVLCGDITNFDLVKIHVRSGKVTLLKYEDFEGVPLPRLVERVKVKLRDQDQDLFSYGDDYPPTLLYYKSRYINEEFPGYAEQVRFEQELDALALLDLSGYGPSESQFHRGLDAARWQVDGFNLIRSRRVPDPGEPCGRFLTYRDFIECGETQLRSQIPNLPKEADSYTALFELASNVLDPVIEYFGMLRLTYGFCSRELAKIIPGRIAPELDQHASHERKRDGNPVCKRLGSAVDFLVEDEDMSEVADWIIANLPFDRLYYYGRDSPVHVSYGPENRRIAFRMDLTRGGRRVPRPYSTASKK